MKKFIREEMIMEDGHNYQPVMIKALMKKGKATKEEIMSKLHEENLEHPPEYFRRSPVFEVLTESHPVAKFNVAKKMYELLNYEEYANEKPVKAKKAAIVRYCNQKIRETKNRTNQNSFWIASGHWRNWEHTINNLPVRWGTKQKEKYLWDILKVGDIVFCSASSRSEKIII